MVSAVVLQYRRVIITTALLLGYKFYERPRHRGDPYLYELVYPNGRYCHRAFRFKWDAAWHALEREGVDPKSLKP